GPLGLSDYRIPDASMTASSIWGPWLAARCGRVNRTYDDICNGAWNARNNNQKQYLQIDLGNLTLISGLATQGRAANLSQQTHQYVKSYSLDHSLDGMNWESYTENEVVKTFPGNVDLESIVKNILNEKLVTRFVRIKPSSWESAIVMRAELYG
ncbi:predicted protein, partial [Nematostella vectensis]